MNCNLLIKLKTITLLIPYSDNKIDELDFTLNNLSYNWKKLHNYNFQLLIFIQCLKKNLGPSKEFLFLIKKYKKFFDELSDIDLRFQYQTDYGIYDAINKAIKNIFSSYVIICGAGDSIELNTINNLLTQNYDPFSIHIFNTKFRFSKKIIKSPKGYMLAYKNICQQSILYKTSILKKYRFNNLYKIQADYYWNLKYIRFIPKKYHDKVLGIYNEVDGISKDKNIIDKEFFKIKTNLVIHNFSILIASSEFLYRMLIRIKRFFIK